jgi:hypothetical protein
MGSGCIDPLILDLGTRWKWVVSFTPRLFYTPEKEVLVPVWTGGRVGIITGLDNMEKRKIT